MPSRPLTGRKAMASSEASAFNFQVKSYLLEMIKMADDKAKACFAVSTAILVYLFNVKPNSSFAVGRPVDWSFTLQSAIWTTSSIVLLISSALSFFVLLPRMGTSVRGIIFFSSIAEFESASHYAENISMRNSTALFKHGAMHNFELSTVAVKKYKALRRAMTSGFFGVMLLLLFLFI